MHTSTTSLAQYTEISIDYFCWSQISNNCQRAVTHLKKLLADWIFYCASSRGLQEHKSWNSKKIELKQKHNNLLL